MKCINKFISLSLVCCFLITGCGNTHYQIPYEADSSVSSYNILYKADSKVANTFAEKLCVVTENIMNEELDMEKPSAAVLFDLNNQKTLYAKNPHEKLYPASLTKVMTALVALKYGSADQVLTASNTVNISESGAQLCGLKVGDTMTLNQALYVLLMYSANDVAMLIAENIGGSVDGFMEMVNKEARAIGATNTNFTNPHGLSDINHYTTAYDLYLMFNEAIKYEQFNEIIHMLKYETTYYSSTGVAKELSFTNTNLFLRGDYKAPENVTIVGGKTGTTNAAGHCLILLSRDNNGAPYISVILSSKARDELYNEMTELLSEISK